MAVIRGKLKSDSKKMALMERMVLGSWRGINYIRSSWEQPYTNSESQRENRGRFAEAVKAYQDLSPSDKGRWLELAREIEYGGSGYNLFISWYLGRLN
ncbi:hypothetical protein I0Q91_02090 [Halanaerobiaceae bacterium Z-7014]|uniref:Uncharacterized protein n=1 Tax=Halonatronomonas betaini TaxID=2778430 RepID=A0A931AN45_9FIRM|nr:hypothetical protein [Halonatronomonas betaini]MBF8435858.1 hypothetical protein [Halonatronomonas betaini]